MICTGYCKNDTDVGEEATQRVILNNFFVMTAVDIYLNSYVISLRSARNRRSYIQYKKIII